MDNLTRITATNSSNYFHRQLWANVNTIGSSFVDASRIIGSDIAKILETFKYKGGFSSIEEAKAWMNTPMTKKAQNDLIAQAMKIKDPVSRKKWMIRASAPSYLHRTKAKEALLDSIRMNNAALQQVVQGKSAQVFGKMAQESYIRAGFDMSKTTGYAFTTSQLPQSTISSILRKSVPKKYQNYFASEWSQRVHKDLVSNITAGKSVNSITKAIHTLGKDQQYRTMRYVRTFMTSVNTEADLRGMLDAGFTHYRYVATLDEITCPVCGSVDNKAFPIVEAEAGDNAPPMHYNCRCATVAVFDDEVRKGSTRIARDEFGNPIKVPSDMTYAEYKEKYLDKADGKLSEYVKDLKEEADKAISYKSNLFKDVADEDLAKEIKSRLRVDVLGDFTDYDLSSLREVAESIDEMYTDLGITEEIETMGLKDMDINTYAEVNFTPFEGRNNISMDLSLNSMFYHKMGSDMLKDKISVVHNYNHFAVPTKGGIIRHEMGHVTHGVLVKRTYPNNLVMQMAMADRLAAIEVNNALKIAKRLPEYSGMSSNAIIRKISPYAHESYIGKEYSDVISEANSDYRANGSGANLISLILIGNMRRRIKR